MSVIDCANVGWCSEATMAALIRLRSSFNGVSHVLAHNVTGALRQKEGNYMTIMPIREAPCRILSYTVDLSLVTSTAPR